MKNKNLLNLLSNFSEKEIKEFREFLKSPFFVKNKTSIQVFNEVISNRNLIVMNQNEKLVKKLCDKFNYYPGTLGKKFTVLAKLAVDYLRIKSITNNKVGAGIMLNQYLFNRNEINILENKMNELSSLIRNNELLEDNEYFYTYKFNVLSYDISLYSKEFSVKSNVGKKFKILNDAAENISLYTLIQLTSLFVNYFFLNVKSGSKKEYSFPIYLNGIYKEFDNNLFIENENKKLIYEIYREMFNLFYEHNNITNYSKYKSIVLNNIKNLNKFLINYHFQVLINFCISKEQLGENMDYFKEECVKLLYQFYKDDYYNINDRSMNPIDYMNFVSRAFSIGDYNRLKSFIDMNSKKLLHSHYNDMVNYGLTYYYFGKNDYRKALKCINNISNKRLIYRFDVRNLELRIYYELNKTEFLLDAIHNYHKTITTDNMLTKSDKEGLFKMLKHLNKLIQIKNNTDVAKQKEELEYNIKIIEKESLFSLKKWILEKYKEIFESLAKKKSGKLANKM